jgi:N-methylhydantoinase B
MNRASATAGRLDGITLEIIGQRIAEIVSTMEVLLFHSGYSTILRESNDGSAAFLDRDGHVVMAVGMPVHLTAYYYSARGVLDRHPWETMKPGDSYVINDPYIGGMQHVPDMAVLTPVFWEGRPLGFCGTIAHKPDVGGIVPGSSGAASREIFHEGLLVPGIKYWTAEGPVEDAVAMVMRNSRVPEVVAGDIRAQLGATRKGNESVGELVAQYGYEQILEAMERLQEISYERTCDAIERWPDGEGEGESFFDSDGVDLNHPVRIHVRAIKRGRSLTIDFSGTDPQAPGPINLRPQGSETASLIAILGYLDPSIPVNGGTQRAITFVNPPGRLTNAQFPSPVNSYFATLAQVLATAQRALLALSPLRCSAPDGFGTGALTIGYLGTRTGHRQVQYEITNPSLGASKTFDGAFSVMPVVHVSSSAPVEILETEFPVRFVCVEPRIDSGGAGEHRGGVGCTREYELLDDASFTLRAGGFASESWGVEGGAPGQKGRCILDRGDGSAPESIPALHTTRLPAGARIRLELAGGAGFGDPRRRASEDVLDDVRDGYVSPEAAEELYGVRTTSGDNRTVELAAE